jgi:hypothetical protein
LTTAVVEALILLAVASFSSRDAGLAVRAVSILGGLIGLFGVGLICLLLNGVAGHIASQRGESWGGEVTIIAIGVWGVTIVVLKLLSLCGVTYG